MGILEEQLKGCAYADLSNFDPATNTYHIPKYSKPTFDINKCYLVKISRRLVNNPASVEATNWNRGTSPSSEYLKAFVSKSLGKMVYVDSLVYDPETKAESMTIWSGWLPIDEMTQLAVVQ